MRIIDNENKKMKAPEEGKMKRGREKLSFQKYCLGVNLNYRESQMSIFVGNELETERGRVKERPTMRRTLSFRLLTATFLSSLSHNERSTLAHLFEW